MRLLALITLFVSIGVHACPELTAQYSSCVSYSGRIPDSHNMVISQSTLEGTTTYNISQISGDDSGYYELNLIADGKEYQVNEEEGIVTTIKTECIGNSVRYVKTLSYDGKPFGYMIHQYEKKSNQLEIKFKMGAIRVGNPTKDLIVCR